MVTAEPLQASDVAACGAILESLSNWFGIPESNRAHLASLRDLPAFVAGLQADVAGFVVIAHHDPQSAEIHVIAVAPDLGRRGVGRLLVREVEAWLRARGVVWLRVKTRGPSRIDPFYAETQRFYEAMGFTPLFETAAFWGEQDPTLLLIKCLLPAGHGA